MKFSRLYILATVLAVFLTGCASARLNQFSTFAQAGITYVNASQTLLTEAGKTSINADSALLISTRPNLSTDQRLTNVGINNTLMQQRIEILGKIGRHGRLLGQYFQALSALADPKAGGSVGTAAQSAFNSIAKLSPDIKSAKIGGTSVADFIPLVAKPIVAAYKVQALDNELKARGESIAQEIALQQAAFQAIAKELSTDARVIRNLQESATNNQYASASSLPSDWAAQRIPLMSPPPPVAASNAAADAADQLGKAWQALLANKLDGNGFNLLMTDISNLLTIAQTVENAVK